MLKYELPPGSSAMGHLDQKNDEPQEEKRAEQEGSARDFAQRRGVF